MIKRSLITALLLSLVTLCSWSNNPTHYVKVGKGKQAKAPFQLGTAINPEGKSIYINSESMVIDGQPVLPVMGEIHFSRIPEAEWKRELLKMKAGGINIIANYIFWIHHEEIEGVFDWEGQRNLRRFIETCGEVGLPLVLRVGPWCHGEARNGGIPEWLLDTGIALRRDNAEYLAKVRPWFEQIYQQAAGLQWKEGGPIVGMQLENEYRGRGEHLITLKNMMQEIGFDLPLYTRTGWPALTVPIPFGEIIPLYGDYADGFWDRSINKLPGNYWKSFIFRSFRNSTVIATEQLPPQSDKDNPNDLAYPFFTCELGGGMMTSYHRRILMDPMDTYAMALVKVGSGSNLPGYYMYHGGTNPEGKRTTMNERQDTRLTNHNDLPVKTYDFQAPLGEFGQVNPHYHLLRQLHLFLDDFGSELTAMSPNFPADSEESFKADSVLRWSVRSNGESGYVFVSNYQRLTPLSPKENVRFTIDLPNQELVFPETPISIPSGESFFMPFNLEMEGVRLIYSTAQPLARISNGKESVYVFKRNRGIEPEFVFDPKEVKVKASNVKADKRDGAIFFKNVKTGLDTAIRFKGKENKNISIILLDEEAALSFWKGELDGKEYFLLSNSNLTYHNSQLELTQENGMPVRLSIYPKPKALSWDATKIKGKRNGIFTEYQVTPQASSDIKANLVQIKREDPAVREIKKGKGGVAEQPSEADFDKAAVWKVTFPKGIDPTRDLFLKIPYTGDVARVYLNGKLLTDNFYNGNELLIGLKRYAPEIYQGEVTIQILPLSRDLSMIYLPNGESLFSQTNKDYLLELPKVELLENSVVSLDMLNR